MSTVAAKIAKKLSQALKSSPKNPMTSPPPSPRGQEVHVVNKQKEKIWRKGEA